MRCMHEKKFHAVSWFVTFTYDDEFLPPGGTLVKRDMQLFWKRLRKFRKFRYYMCGEYGSQTNRPHYHAIIFGLELDDLKLYKRGKGSNLYNSKFLQDIWGKGHVVIGDVTFESCAYVSRYITEKITGERAESWYTRVDRDGVIWRMLPEYTDMSRRPGIGHSYFEKYGAEVFTHDSVVVNGREVRPPRYYDVKMAAIDPKRMEALKSKRRRAASVHKDEQTPERRRVRERFAELTLSQMKRSEL